MSDLETDYMKLVCLTALLKATGTHKESWEMLIDAHQYCISKAPDNTKDEMRSIFEKHFAKPFSHLIK